MGMRWMEMQLYSGEGACIFVFCLVHKAHALLFLSTTSHHHIISATHPIASTNIFSRLNTTTQNKRHDQRTTRTSSPVDSILLTRLLTITSTCTFLAAAAGSFITADTSLAVFAAAAGWRG